MSGSFDIVVVGGGVIGLAIADRLAGLGRSVCIVDASSGGQASWAASGSLALIMPDVAPAPMRPFASKNQAAWPGFAAGLEERAGMPIEHVRSGLLRLVRTEEDQEKVGSTVRWLLDHGVAIERIDGDMARKLAPLVADDYVAAYHQPDLWQVRPPRLLRALAASTASRGVVVRSHEPVLDLLREGDRVIGVRTTAGLVAAGEVVLSAGAWSTDLAWRALAAHLPMKPVRGQMVLLGARGVPTCPLLLDPSGSYLIRRSDGRVLAGSTFEYAGFDPSVTASGVHSILGGSFRIAPTLADAPIDSTWSGLRPEGPDRLPYLGRLPGIRGLVVATGHFRDGILLAPVTAEVVEDLVEGRAPSTDIEAFRPDRELQPVAP